MEIFSIREIISPPCRILSHWFDFSLLSLSFNHHVHLFSLSRTVMIFDWQAIFESIGCYRSLLRSIVAKNKTRNLFDRFLIRSSWFKHLEHAPGIEIQRRSNRTRFCYRDQSPIYPYNIYIYINRWEITHERGGRKKGRKEEKYSSLKKVYRDFFN